MKKKVATRRLIKPLSADERRGLEDMDELLKALIRQNRQLHARVDRLAHAVTSLGEPEIDRLLKTIRKRLHTAMPARVPAKVAAKATAKKIAIPRRRVRAA